METDPQLVPSVISVVVVHDPGDWFDEMLIALASQDYGNLRHLFLLTPHDTDDTAELTERIQAVLPSAFVRAVSANDGFGPSANEVLDLVDGDNGLLLICHDDIVPAPNAVRTLVAELFRSNAGIVGPKLTDWDHPRILQHVGLGLDRFGETDAIVEPDEVDQEQHDATRDVFVLPSACFLIRVDLFRALGGFDPEISFHGEDVDLCWRAHLTGARVIVVPDARVRHLETLVERRPDLNHRALAARHRMRTVASLTGAPRMIVRSIELLVLTALELVIGIFTGRSREAVASLRALLGLLPRSPSIIRRRLAIRGQRVVAEREVLRLQNPGSSRLTEFLRGREHDTYVNESGTVRRWREVSFGPALAWFVFLLALVIGSRGFIRSGVPAVGEFLPFPSSPSDLVARYRSAFDARSFGATAANPTGWGVLSIAGIVMFARMGLLMTVTVLGMYVAGAVGIWRLAAVFPSSRARVIGMVVYVGSPLVPGMLAFGEFSGLLLYAALPWLVHLSRRVAGLAAADPKADAIDVLDGIGHVTPGERVSALAYLSLAVALAAAFVPVVLVMWAAVGALLALGTLLAGGSVRIAGWFGAATATSVLVGGLLNLPWSATWRWESLVGARPEGSAGRSVFEAATLAPDMERFAVLAIALYVPVFAAVAITRAWRLTWSVRAGVLVASFLGLIVASNGGLLGFPIPEPALLATPVILGISIAAAAIADGFGSDVLGRGFGWRQPVALLANVAIIVGLIPAVISIGDGNWHTPNSMISEELTSQLPANPAVGDFRILYVGDPRVLPVPGRELNGGIAYAVADGVPLQFTDRFQTPATAGNSAVVEALDLAAAGSTLRLGHLLAPLGIRYIVVPHTNGAESTVENPIALPAGLLETLDAQLDLGSVYGVPSLEIFINFAFLPVGAQLSGPSAEMSNLAGAEVLVGSDLSGGLPSMVGLDAGTAAANEVAPGVVHIAVPFDPRFNLDVDGVDYAPRTGFGVTTAFDVEQAGVGHISYNRGWARPLWLASQLLMWLFVLLVATRGHTSFRRHRFIDEHDETLIDLTDAPPISVGVAGEMLGVPTWSEGSAASPEADLASLVANVEWNDAPREPGGQE